MNELSQFLVESIIGEADSVDNIVVVYAGRFQPFHKGHYATYSHLVKKFGKNNVYIGTSNKTDNNKSPFNFKEKVMIITKMFGIPKNKIVQVKNPYVPTEVLKKFDKDTTAFITVVGKKDASRLGGKFFTPYKDGIDFEGYEDRGYVYIAPQQSNPISGTEVRNGLKSGSDEDKKEFFTKRAYPKFDKKIFDFITNTLSEDVIPKEVVEGWLIQNVDLIKEASQILGAQEVDDGPNYIFPNFQIFDRVSKKRAEQIGYTVLAQIMSAELTDIDPHPIYPNGPVKAVTPFPAGVAGKTTATNQKDFYGSQAYDKWWKHVTRVAGLVGYSLVDFIELEDEREESLRDLDKEKEEVGNTLKEDINLPVNVGDTILTGRFKNKKTVVKTIGKDEHGMPTINGRKVVNFRILKEGVEVELNEFGGVRFDLVGYGSNNKPVLKTIKRASDSFSKEVVKHWSQKLFKSGKGVEYVKIYYDKHHLMTVTDGGRKQIKEKGWGKLPINEIPMADLVKIDQYADKQLNPVDVVLTDKHFFDRLTDPRNKKEISQAELIGFFKRLGKKKKDFLNFLNLYGQIVAKDNRTNLNIPFMKQANKVIAKTIMRKDDFKTPDPKYKFEGVNDFFYMDFKKWVYKNRAKVNRMNHDDKIKFLSNKYMKDHGKWHRGENTKNIGLELINLLIKDKIIKENKDTDSPFNDFAKGRGNGAGTISSNAKEKGGDSLLTHHHFDVKLPYYEKASNGKFDLEQAKEEFKETHEKINFNMKDIDFQEEMGRLEVLGELIIKYSSLKEYVMFKSNIQSTPSRKGLGDSELDELAPHGYPDQKWMDKHDKEIKKLRKKFDKEKHQYNEPYTLGGGITESLILEGGAYGHMNHPFDTEINLTFGQLKDIVNKALEGNLELTREKTDGQALAVSWRDGRLVAARNKGHLKNKGAGALDINGVAMKFAGRGELEKAYNFAMRDLTKAISKLSEKQREKIFKGGACFMNLEVIYPTSVNVIPYGQALLVFHGTMEYNEDGIAIGENQDAARILAGMIKQVNADVQ